MADPPCFRVKGTDHVVARGHTRLKAGQNSGSGASTIENHLGVQMVPYAVVELVHLPALGIREGRTLPARLALALRHRALTRSAWDGSPHRAPGRMPQSGEECQGKPTDERGPWNLTMGRGGPLRPNSPEGRIA